MKRIGFYFDKAASTYEIASEIQRKVAKDLLTMIDKGYYPLVIEIGSGRGSLTKDLSESIIFHRYVHIDISFELLKRLKRVLDERHIIVNAQAERMPIKRKTANLLVSSSALHWMENQEESFPRIFEILREDGKFYFSIFTSESLKELKEATLLSGFGSYYPLKSTLFYIELFKKLNLKFNYKIKNYIVYFKEPKDLLLSLKLTGTSYTLSKKFSGKKSFLEFCRIYKEKFSDSSGVYATYEVLFIRGQI